MADLDMSITALRDMSVRKAPQRYPMTDLSIRERPARYLVNKKLPVLVERL
jgi:hypothetical protein